MKRRDWAACLTGSFLSILLAGSALNCMATAFSFPTLEMRTVLIWCGGASVIFALFYTLRLQLLPMGSLALLAGYLWYGGSLARSVEGLIYQISLAYDDAYGCGVFSWSGSYPREGDVTMAMCAAAVLITLGVCSTICRRRRAWLAVLLSLLPLAACLVVTDLLPDKLWLYLLLVGILLLVLPNRYRRLQPRLGSKWTAMLVLPVLLAVALLLWAVPQSSYSGQQRAQRLSELFLDWLPTMGQLEEIVSLPVTGISEKETVDLAEVGHRNRNWSVVMEISGTVRGAVYLRGQALDTYTGKTWTDSGKCGQLSWPDQGRLEEAGQLHISTRQALDARYVPYYARGVVPDENGRRIENSEKRRTYSYTVLALGDSGNMPVVDLPKAYTELPADTAVWAGALLEQVLRDVDREKPEEVVGAIADYVRRSAVYDLDVAAMPRWETDFVRWFLEEQDAGYCVHFASAATVLLRAAGIPARYATGYLSVMDKNTVLVRGKDAHAWTEYWDGTGWMVLDATAAAADLQQPDAAPEQADDQTGATETSLPEQTIPVFSPSEPEQQAGNALQWIWMLLKILILAGLAVWLAVFQWRLRLLLRLRRLKRGTVDTRAVALWQEAVRLSRLLGEPPENGLFATAQKAKFSQHRLAPEELAPMETYIRDARARLRGKPLYLRLVYQLVLAVC